MCLYDWSPRRWLRNFIDRADRQSRRRAPVHERQRAAQKPFGPIDLAPQPHWRGASPVDCRNAQDCRRSDSRGFAGTTTRDPLSSKHTLTQFRLRR
jgi:hypothetical protein